MPRLILEREKEEARVVEMWTSENEEAFVGNTLCEELLRTSQSGLMEDIRSELQYP